MSGVSLRNIVYPTILVNVYTILYDSESLSFDLDFEDF